MTQPARVRWTKKLFSVHGWAGLFFGVIIFIYGVSGAILAFGPEIDELLFPHLHKVTPQETRVSLNEIYEKVRRLYPDAWGLRFRQLNWNKPDSSLQMSLSRITNVSDKDWFYLYANPYTGEILGLQNGLGNRGLKHNPIDWFLWLHINLLSGKPGDILMAAAGVAFLVSLLSGVIVYRKKIFSVLLFKTKVHFKDWRSVSSGLHRVIGVWALVLNLVLVLTGLWIIRYRFVPSTYTKAKVEQIDRTPSPALRFSMDAVVEEILKKYPQFIPAGISAVEQDQKTIRVSGSMQGASSFFNAYTDQFIFNVSEWEIEEVKLLKDRSIGMKFNAMAGPLHFGTWGGVPVKILYVFGGLAPAVLSITGFSLWAGRRKGRFHRRRLSSSTS